MNLTKREQIMLSVLLIIAIVAGGYYLLLKPMLAQMLELKSMQAQLQSDYQQITSEIDNLANLQADADNQMKALGVRTQPYYPSIIQEQIILTLNQLYLDSEITVSNESFMLDYLEDYGSYSNPEIAGDTQPALSEAVKAYAALGSEKAAETPEEIPAEPNEDEQKQYEANVSSIDSMSVTIEFSAPYSNIIGFIQSIENLNRKIQINYIDLIAPEDAQPVLDEAGNVIEAAPVDNALSGSIELVFHSIPKLSEQDQAYTSWTLPADSGKTDPFVS